MERLRKRIVKSRQRSLTEVIKPAAYDYGLYLSDHEVSLFVDGHGGRCVVSDASEYHVGFTCCHFFVVFSLPNCMQPLRNGNHSEPKFIGKYQSNDKLSELRRPARRENARVCVLRKQVRDSVE